MLSEPARHHHRAISHPSLTSLQLSIWIAVLLVWMAPMVCSMPDPKGRDEPSRLLPSASSTLSEQARTRKQLKGRFVHLTDMHPDPFYVYNSSEAGSCHSEKPLKGARAGYWGTSVSECDAPLNLINATFDWLEANFKGEVDFVVWTGDNARHDIDSRTPRTMPEIFRLNEYTAQRIRQTFGKVPVVTSIGNNDIYPHNIMFAGPSQVTNRFLSIWHHFIPENHLHTFARGGYYSKDAIPDELLLISLNTLYMYEKNKAVDGCPPSKDFSSSASTTPGSEQLQWLEQQLTLARLRGMQVLLTGHVPPTADNWYDDCYKRYGELVLSFHDTIIGHLYGHMNVDHFTMITSSEIFSSKALKRQSRQKVSPNSSPDYSVTTMADDLRAEYLSIPMSHKNTKLKNYNIVNVNPSVIPTYLPAVRIWSYNVTGEKWRQPQGDQNSAEETELAIGYPSNKGTKRGKDDNEEDNDDDDDEEEDDHDDHDELDVTSGNPNEVGYQTFFGVPSSLVTAPLRTLYSLLQQFNSDMVMTPINKLRMQGNLNRKKKKKKKKHGKKKKKDRRPRLPRYFSSESPSQKNRYLSLLGYVQYYIQLDEANANSGYGPGDRGRTLLDERKEEGQRPPPQWEIEYSTFQAEKLAQVFLSPEPDLIHKQRDEVMTNQQATTIPLRALSVILPTSIQEVLASTKSSDRKIAQITRILREKGLTPYELPDLTIGSWLDLGRRLGKHKKAWKGYLHKMYVSSDSEDS